MFSSRGAYAGLLLIAAGLSSGCTSTWSPKTALPVLQAATTTAPRQVVNDLNSPPATDSATSSDMYGQMPVQNASAIGSSGGVVLASLRQAGTSLASALRIEPKVTPAIDPVKLDNGPADTEKVAADLHFHAGYFFETQNKFSEAAAHYRDAMKTNPNDSRSIAGYGRVQDQLGNLMEADKHLRRACELAPQDPGPRSDLAQSYARRGDFQTAITYQQQALTLQPSSQVQRAQLAKLLVSVGRADEAFQSLLPTHGEARARAEVAQMVSGMSAVASAPRTNQSLPAFQPRLDRDFPACSCPNHAAHAGVTRLPASF